MDLHDSLLFKRLESSSVRLSSSLEETWKLAGPLLSTIAATHRTFTSHGPDHSLAVLKILDAALEPLPDVVDELRERELYVLICAALVHDIGMVGPVCADAGEQDRIRRDHNVRSMQYIREHGTELSIPRDLQPAVAKTVVAHRGAQIRDILPETLMVGELEIRLWLCAALVRLADECHAANDRIPQDYSMLSLPEESESHFRAHSLVSGPIFFPARGEVKFSAEIDSDDDEICVGDKMEGIAGELNLLAPVLSKYEIPYKTACCEEDRIGLVRMRVLRELLRTSALTCMELAQGTGEKLETIESTMKMIGGASPFERSEVAGEKSYSLETSENVFLVSRQAISWTNDERQATVYHAQASSLCDPYS